MNTVSPATSESLDYLATFKNATFGGEKGIGDKVCVSGDGTIIALSGASSKDKLIFAKMPVSDGMEHGSITYVWVEIMNCYVETQLRGVLAVKAHSPYVVQNTVIRAVAERKRALGEPMGWGEK